MQLREESFFDELDRDGWCGCFFSLLVLGCVLTFFLFSFRTTINSALMNSIVNTEQT